jgi:serine/threonine protein kinase
MLDDQWLGSELAGYRIDALVGRGGVGVVYRATHLLLERPAAVKLLGAGLAADPEYRRRFEREAHLAAGLEHPHIVPIYDAGYAEGVLYLAMRYIDGPNLATAIAGDGPMDLPRVCELLTGVAEALDSAHHAGLVHRDVKPANVLLTSPGQPQRRQRAYLCDFGIARRTASSSSLTTTGQFLGTLRYCAPEQIQGQLVDGRADQYALGCVIYECLTGRVPYPAEEPAAVMFAHLSAVPPRASAHNPALPAAVDDVIARALAKHPDQRFPDCTTFVQALATAHHSTAPVLPSPAPPVPATPHSLIWPRSREDTPPPPTTPRTRSNLSRILFLLGLPLLALLIPAAMLWARPPADIGGATPPPPPTPSIPATSPSAPPTSAAPAVPIGDPRLVDHCAFLDPAQLAGFGTPYAGPRIDGSFNQCVLHLSLSSGGKAEIGVSFIKTNRTIPGSAEQRGSLRIVRATAAQVGCPRNILFPEEITVAVSARIHDVPGDVCAITDTVTENAVRILLERGVPQLPSPGEANSLRSQNACTVVDDQTLSRVPGLDPSRRYERFGGWGCPRGNNPYVDGFQPPAVDVFFQWVRPLTSDDGERVQVAGREVYIRRAVGGNGHTACYARVVHRDRPLSDGERAQEIVVLAVYAEIPESEQCRLARDVATAVISTLPPP